VPLYCGTTAKSKPILGPRSDFRIIGNFANQKVDLMSEVACTKILFSPEGDFAVIEKGIADFLREINC
jgi:hypothetical protein